MREKYAYSIQKIRALYLVNNCTWAEGIIYSGACIEKVEPYNGNTPNGLAKCEEAFFQRLL